jgi:hypothetical protein
MYRYICIFIYIYAYIYVCIYIYICIYRSREGDELNEGDDERFQVVDGVDNSDVYIFSSGPSEVYQSGTIDPVDAEVYIYTYIYIYVYKKKNVFV